MLHDVLNGLQCPDKFLSSKYLYDKRGSELFEQITRLEEYYPTRTELQILRNHIEEIAGYVGKNACLIELGSGNSEKTRLLLDHLHNLNTYVPIDISGEFLDDTVQNLERDYPELNISPIVADYTRDFQLHLSENDYDCIVFFYPGSTIGNFTPPDARTFLNQLAKSTKNSSELIIGVDLKKEKKILEAAYNDSKGITAAFNINSLKHINNKLNADFNSQKFLHKAFFNEKEGRIEMRLMSTEAQKVKIADTEIDFQKGEEIRTEYSYKYSIHEFLELTDEIFEPVTYWTDENNYFSVFYMKAATDTLPRL